ncbi:MAG: OmpH family outer membrane protein [Actinobacteria bacterium]|nr:OmpH family outer membrane protein [Actinomycetota bacterium]
MKTKLSVKTVVVVAIALLSLTLVAALGVYAADSGGTLTYPSIVEKIAKAFNLDPSKVKEVFDQDRKDKEAEAQKCFQQLFENRLNQAVKKGEITQAQKEAIIAKMAEVKAAREKINNDKLSAEERNDALAQLQEGLREWAEKNGIDVRLVISGMMGGRMRGMGGGRMHGPGAFRGGPPEGLGDGTNFDSSMRGSNSAAGNL